jgi:hypothetical protein
MAGVKGMHARHSTSPSIADAIRARIKGAQIAEKLAKHILEGEEMSKSQVTAGLGLLKKVVPDLSSTELTGDPDKPLRGVLTWGKPE